MSQWLTKEAVEANHIKRDIPVMCIIGNPPYSVSSSNKSEWIENLTGDYKKNLNERNINPLSDDYIKFIRYGQHFIDKNGSGVLAYISNNSFLDGLIHRQMRKNLLESFDKIYILDLHGNAKRNEVSKDGTSDQNVFDIMAGVSINIFIKTENKKKNSFGRIYHYDLYGKRDIKYDFLKLNSLKTIKFNELKCLKPNYFFVRKNFENIEEYEKGFILTELFLVSANGMKTERDIITLHFTEQKLNSLKEDLIILENETFRSKYDNKPDGRDWKISTAQLDLKNNNPILSKVLYRPFDERYTLYTGKSKGFHSYPRHNLNQHMLKENLILLTSRQQSSTGFQHSFISVKMIESCSISSKTKETTYGFPLYLYPYNKNDGIFTEEKRKPNLNLEIVEQIAEKLELEFTNEKEEKDNTFAPIDILDYIYAVLHSPTYRETYKEFLKIDFPRVPYPKDKETFCHLVKLGGEIRQIHLLESPKVKEYITSYPIDGDNNVIKPRFDSAQHDNNKGRVYINDTQYFNNVPEVAWNFYIGGYQPAQKWLKDRKGRELSFEDILHYQKIIVALTETDRLMEEIDGVEIE